MATRAPAVPTGMRRVYRRFERWRSSHSGRLPIPQPLWASAVDLARAHSISKTAQALHLEHGKLRRLVESASPVARSAPPQAAFLELLTPAPAGLWECHMELEGPRGKVRIQRKGTTAPDLAGLSRALREPA